MKTCFEHTCLVGKGEGRQTREQSTCSDRHRQYTCTNITQETIKAVSALKASLLQVKVSSINKVSFKPGEMFSRDIVNKKHKIIDEPHKYFQEKTRHQPNIDVMVDQRHRPGPNITSPLGQ